MSDLEHDNFVAFVNALHLTKDQWAEARDVLTLADAVGAPSSQIREAIVRRFGHRQNRFLVADGRIVGGLN